MPCNCVPICRLLYSSHQPFLFYKLVESNTALSSGLLAHYRSLVEQGKLQHDPYQEKVATELENLLGRLEQYEKDMEEYHVRVLYCDNELLSKKSVQCCSEDFIFNFHAFRKNLHNGRIIGKVGGVSFLWRKLRPNNKVHLNQ